MNDRCIACEGRGWTRSPTRNNNDRCFASSHERGEAGLTEARTVSFHQCEDVNHPGHTGELAVDALNGSVTSFSAHDIILQREPTVLNDEYIQRRVTLYMKEYTGILTSALYNRAKRINMYMHACPYRVPNHPESLIPNHPESAWLCIPSNRILQRTHRL